MCVCRKWRSGRYGCYRLATGSQIKWIRTLRPFSKNSSCLCLAEVSQNTGRSRMYSLPHFVYFKCKVISLIAHTSLCSIWRLGIMDVSPHFCYVIVMCYMWHFLQTSLDVTETFKQQKVKLVTEGFDPDVTHDLLYFLDVSQKDYTLLTVSLYQDIVNGKIKVWTL